MIAAEQLDVLWILFAAVLVLIMQAGFLCLESGLTRAKNSINVAVKNVADLVVSVLGFWVVGFTLMFGVGAAGGSHWLPPLGTGNTWLDAFFLFQAMFCATTATILSGACAERTRFMVYIALSALVTMLIYPLFGHLAWGGLYGSAAGWIEQRGFIDFAGSTVVHSTGGWVALAAIILIGPRQNRFGPDGPAKVPPSDMPLAMLGMIWFLVGWIGFNGGSTLALSDAIAGIIVNTILGATTGAAVAFVVGPKLCPNTDTPVLPLNGALAGMVAVTANCAFVTGAEAALIAAVGAVVMLLCDRLLLKLRLDDAIGAIPVHLAAGIWGTVAVALFGDLETLGTGLSRFEQLEVQCLGIVVCAVWSFSVAYAFLRLLRAFTPLRVSPEAELAGLNVSEHGARTALTELLDVMSAQHRGSDWSLRAPVEPFTEVGQIAETYNRVMEALETNVRRTTQIVRDLRDGIVTFSTDGTLTSMNPGAEHLLGLDANRAVGLPLPEVLVSSGFRWARGSFTDVIEARAGEPAAGHELVRGRDREDIRILEIRSDPSLDGGSEQLTAILRDITDRRRLEEKLNRQRELAQVTLESLGEGVITTNREGFITSLNPVAERILGAGNRRLAGEHFNQVFQVEDAENGNRIATERIVGRNDGSRIERFDNLRLLRLDGDAVYITVTSAPIRNRKQVVLGSVVIFQDVSKSRELERMLAYQASHDQVTGLLNRREFEVRLQEAVRTARTDRTHHVMCYVDLDQFKIVNDTCGHHAGDELLRQLSTVIQDALRESDTLARLGGDEFGILLHNCPNEQGFARANRVRAAIEAFRFGWQGRTFSVGSSIGIVGISHHAPSWGEIMSMADAACYVAKENGRNRVHAHKAGDADVKNSRGQMQWASRIQEAVDEDRFRLYYQPIVPADPDSGLKEHIEIFVRMLDKSGELVPPGAFIPAAERYDLMTSIDRWVVRNTFAWLATEANRERRCAINLSGASITNSEFLEFVKDQVRGNRILPANICFEITETSAVASLKQARRFIDELKSLDCQFALDDFGSGLSSFGYLKSLPVDYLKIDGIFVRDILTDKIDHAMVESINSIGMLMGLKTIAEFVENEEIAQCLKGIGVDYLQGYHLGKPKPLSDLGGTGFWPR